MSALQSRAVERVQRLLGHFKSPSSTSPQAESKDELERFMARAEEMREASFNAPPPPPPPPSKTPPATFVPYVIVPSFVDQSTQAARQNRERRSKRVKILYDVHTPRAQMPTHLDVSLDDANTPLAFRFIRIILLTAEARRAQDIHFDQYSSNAMSVTFVTQHGITKRIVVKGSVVQDIIGYLAHYESLISGKPLPGPIHDFALSIKVRPTEYLHGTHRHYRVNSIRTNHELGYYHIVMRVLQS
eukprot:gnl/Spiro4/13596_TR7243_c0_g1_i1.p1 gnl/Spiro4/13596_TR7243_c0_g1~~gnl/Spiro4/13596_TR7243_c0_g1_i1.p1  ORF type:complete len:244 (+),score=23.06 gnl/Spiro4/13596_TR7243_c0_g1_i1:62-793(+)